MGDDLFGGSTYEPKHDKARLSLQVERVKKLMLDGKWRTLQEIELRTGDGVASISARLRDLRKAKFGGYKVERRRRGEPKKGLFEYRIADVGDERAGEQHDNPSPVLERCDLPGVLPEAVGGIDRELRLDGPVD